MTTVDEPQSTLGPVETAPVDRVDSDRTDVERSDDLGYLRRPIHTTGWRAWAFTVDHKKIGIMYGATALFFFFIVGGVEATLIRLQLAAPDGKVLSADLYNQMFTMHATTMVFLFVMPLAAASPTISSRCRSAPATSHSRG